MLSQRTETPVRAFKKTGILGKAVKLQQNDISLHKNEISSLASELSTLKDQTAPLVGWAAKLMKANFLLDLAERIAIDHCRRQGTYWRPID